MWRRPHRLSRRLWHLRLGTSACALVLSLHLIGHKQTAVYDGAWTEWAGEPTRR